MPDELAETDQTQGQATSNIAWFLTARFHWRRGSGPLRPSERQGHPQVDFR